MPNRYLYNSDRVYSRSVGSLAVDLERSRPEPDTDLEQFHMSAASMAALAEACAPFFNGERVLFLGDDDHMSVLLAAVGDIGAKVFEVDGRVVESLNAWRSDLRLRDYSAEVWDIRNPLDWVPKKCEGFFLNPPYSSKTGGYAIRFWLSRALDACVQDCNGVVVMPADSSIDWVNAAWLSMQDFVTKNGFRILAPANRGGSQLYLNTNIPGLASEALFLQRVDPSRRVREEPRAGAALYR